LGGQAATEERMGVKTHVSGWLGRREVEKVKGKGRGRVGGNRKKGPFGEMAP